MPCLGIIKSLSSLHLINHLIVRAHITCSCPGLFHAYTAYETNGQQSQPTQKISFHVGLHHLHGGGSSAPQASHTSYRSLLCPNAVCHKSLTRTCCACQGSRGISSCISTYSNSFHQYTEYL